MEGSAKGKKLSTPALDKVDSHQQRKEIDVGISEYVCKGPGFSAILKQRYSDFQVHEIDMDGTIVHLTDRNDVKYVERHETEEVNIFTAEQWEKIEVMIKTGDPKMVEFDITDKSKEVRQNIHKTLRAKYEDVKSNSVHVDGKTIMKIFKMEGEEQTRRNDQRRLSKVYTQFVLYKENTSTMEAINTIARVLKIKSSFFMTAGTKDKRAMTSQLVTVNYRDPAKILNSVQNSTKIAVGNFCFTNKPLQLGNLKGNRFEIALRNVIGNQQQIVANLESLKQIGFINYYGSHCFGTRHVPTHHIGKQLVLGQWQKAIDLILEPPEVRSKFQRDYDLTMARIEYRSSKDAHKAFSKIKRNLQTIEAKLLLNLKKHGKDLVGALNTIPFSTRYDYIQAYQRFVWNTVVSKRISKFGPMPIVGDLVFAPGTSSDCDVYAERENIESIAEEAENDQVGDDDANGDKEEDGENSNAKAQRNYRQVIFIDENNIKDYTINEIILPLPGFDITYPANEVAGWYRELFEADGLTEMDFKQSTKTYNLGGAYRLLVTKPSDVKWKFLRYDDPTLRLIPSDWDRIHTQPPPAAVIDGIYLGLVLQFSLPASSYATMALREIMKMSAGSQKSLNDAGSAKQTSPAVTAADDTTTGDANERMKRKLEPAVSVESCECPKTKKIKLEPGVTSDGKL
uniref:TRUD domain-containing protein n=1 Tax=Daphnia galeata TaxID=27404 RepID=A0A8J2WQW1_9CRUS|nr:unnamed protein product [Daphnia galeata]